jgi:1-deoxyxylulose-5-phosphate synthase
VSRCLGCMTYGSSKWRPWVLDEEPSRAFIKRALEHGINFFDTANMYSLGAGEEILGRALKDYAKRHEVVIATKVYYKMGEGPNDRGLSRKHIFDQIDASLRRLGTDHVDLYQIHRWDYETPIEETLDALNDVVRAGKASYIGASSMHAWQFASALHLSERHGWARFVSMQNHYNLVYREEEREMIPLCRAEGIGLIPWSPLARGFLAGKPHAGQDRRYDAGPHRQLCARDVLSARRFRRRRPRAAGRAQARAQASAGRAGLAAVAAWPDGADHRRQQDGAAG